MILHGLVNAPAVFKSLVNEVLCDMCVVIYISDIMVYSHSLEKHIGNTSSV